MENNIIELGISTLRKALLREPGYRLDQFLEFLSEQEQTGHTTVCIVPGTKERTFSQTASFQTKMPKPSRKNPARDRIAHCFNHFGNSLMNK